MKNTIKSLVPALFVGFLFVPGCIPPEPPLPPANTGVSHRPVGGENTSDRFSHALPGATAPGPWVIRRETPLPPGTTAIDMASPSGESRSGEQVGRETPDRPAKPSWSVRPPVFRETPKIEPVRPGATGIEPVPRRAIRRNFARPVVLPGVTALE